MPRTARASIGDVCYHVFNRGNAKSTVFFNTADYDDFVNLIDSACRRLPLRVIGHVLMPNHFHMVLWPYGDGDLGRWMQWLMTSHVRRFHQCGGGSGHIWGGRFKAFPIESDGHMLTVLRYVERNPLRAGLVARAQDWAWSSLRFFGAAKPPAFLHLGPVPRPADWVDLVNQAQTAAELEAVRHSVNRGTPFGSEAWTTRVASELGLEATLHERGRPARKRGHSTFPSRHLSSLLPNTAPRQPIERGP